LLEFRFYSGFSECPGIANYKRPRIFRMILHTSNVVTLQTLELLEGWKPWRWEISEVSLYMFELANCGELAFFMPSFGSVALV